MAQCSTMHYALCIFVQYLHYIVECSGNRTAIPGRPPGQSTHHSKATTAFLRALMIWWQHGRWWWWKYWPFYDFSSKLMVFPLSVHVINIKVSNLRRPKIPPKASPVFLGLKIVRTFLPLFPPRWPWYQIFSIDYIMWLAWFIELSQITGDLI